MSIDRDLLAELRRHNLLKPLVRHQIIAEAVECEEVSPEELEEARQQFLTGLKIKDDEGLHTYLLSQGWTTDDFEWQIALPLRIKEHCRKHFQHKAEAHFLTRKNQLDQVVYSLLRTKDVYLAQELYLRIEGGESNFGDLAAQFSEGAERNTKGIVGPVPLNQAHPIVAELLRTTKPGVLLNPVQVGEWWVLMRLESYAAASFNETMAEKLSQELFDQWINEEQKRRMDAAQGSGIQRTAE